MSGQPLIRVRGLHKRYGPVHAVRGVSFDVAPGTVLGFLGANGAGKSTTLAMLAGVLAPSAGRVEIAGVDLAERPLAAKSRLGFLPEVPPLYPELSVDEYLTHCARLRRVPRADVGAAVAEARARCGLADVGRRLLGNLSKGYRQRAGIAQAIVHRPDVVVLDEPTAGLDPAQIVEIRELVRTLGADRAVILSTHILPEVHAVCDRVQILHDGRLVFESAVGALAGGDHRYHARLRRPPAADALLALESVEAASVRGGGFDLELAGGEAGAERFVDECCRRGFGLVELTPLAPSLEERFVAIAMGEPPRGGDGSPEPPP